jgi:hypothetical protein
MRNAVVVDTKNTVSHIPQEKEIPAWICIKNRNSLRSPLTLKQVYQDLLPLNELALILSKNLDDHLSKDIYGWKRGDTILKEE